MISRRVASRKNIAAFTMLVTALAIAAAGCRRAAVTGPPPEVAATVDPWKEAVGKVEQERGEPVGRNATVLVPDELRHYPDRRRFLAVQAADTGARVTTIPKDFAGLVPMIKRREFI
ncbi:MAG TPA: hypothetical protein VNS63_03040, partial [Blastocatellia bacterium]|nr:hypothetical protein [Blastocatellia bacterium]